MPTINEYVDEPGYFIRARPSSVESPITYQIESEGYSIIDSYGLSHEDQVSWSVIQSLKSLGLLYTDHSGVVGADEFEPDPSQLEETSLDTASARRLAEVIFNNIEMDVNQFENILSILGVDSNSFDFTDNQSAGATTSPDSKRTANMPEFPVHDKIDVISGETIYKTDDWWKAAILSDGYQTTEILVYLWRKDGNSWKRRQKYKVKSGDDWEKEKQIIDKLLSQNT